MALVTALLPTRPSHTDAAASWCQARAARVGSDLVSCRVLCTDQETYRNIVGSVLYLACWTSCPYEGHRMGKAERMNRTLEAMARTLLLAAGMDPCLTLEAWL